MHLLVRLWLWLFYRKGWLVGAFINGKRQSKGLPWRPTLTEKGWSIKGGEPHEVTTPCGSLSGTLFVKYRLVGTVTSVEGGEPQVTPFFRREDTKWTGDPSVQHHRWYATQENRYPLTPGEHTIEIPFTPENWKAVLSLTGESSPATFAQSLRDAGRVGLVFGSTGGASHGVRLNGTFEVLEWKIQK